MAIAAIPAQCSPLQPKAIWLSFPLLLREGWGWVSAPDEGGGQAGLQQPWPFFPGAATQGSAGDKQVSGKAATASSQEIIHMAEKSLCQLLYCCF